MFKPLSVLLVSGILLGGCGTVRDSSLNPFNWFGRGKSVQVEANANPLIPKRRATQRPVEVYAGKPVGTVTDVTVERIPGGAIVRATGVSDRQGPYDVELTPEEGVSEGGVKMFTFNVISAGSTLNAGTAASRRVTVATYLTTKELEVIRRIRVSGARNAMESSRR